MTRDISSTDEAVHPSTTIDRPTPSRTNGELFDRARRVLATVISTSRRQQTDPGTVMFTFGRYFAPKADLLTREGFKTIPPLDGVSPFSAAGDPDPAMLPYANCERSNDRVKADVHKDLATQLTESGADYLLVDNSAAALWHCERNGRYYTVLNGEATDLADELWPSGEEMRRDHAFRPEDGLDDGLREAYRAFTSDCLAAFPPERIILVRSRGARFWVGADGAIGTTNLNRAAARLLDELDRTFVEQTGCRIANAALDWNPSDGNWLATDHALRIALEQEVIDLVAAERNRATTDPTDLPISREPSAADLVLAVARTGGPLAEDRLRSYFADGPTTRDDLLALLWLHQHEPDPYAATIRDCISAVVATSGQPLLVASRQRFQRSLDAIRDCPWRTVDLPSTDLWKPQIVISAGRHTFRFHADGSIETVRAELIDDAAALVDDRVPLTPRNLVAALSSWPWYFERGRRGVTAAPRVMVTDTNDLVDSCHWVDWRWALDNENLVVTTPTAKRQRLPGPRTRTNLAFVFHPRTRICTVGGGLMDQVTHIALHDQLCTPEGLTYYIDDFRYTWWRSHNGFEASRLAPALESRRMTRLVSQSLIESFRNEVMNTRLPWVFNQSRTWHTFGLREAVVVTKSHPNALRMLQSEPDFPILVYRDDDDLQRFLRTPPSPVCFYTTQHRAAVAEASAPALHRVFRYRHLVDAGLDPQVSTVAAQLKSSPHVALHVRRGDYLEGHFDLDGWHSGQEHYRAALDHLITEEFGTADFDIAVFSDDLNFVSNHRADYGLDKVTGTVRFVGGNQHYRSILDSYLMSLCPIIVGSVGHFAATTSLLAEAPSTYIRTTPRSLVIAWRR